MYLLISIVVSGAIAAAIVLYDIALLGGMRAANDPVMAFFFLYPFVLSCPAAILFDAMKNCLKGTALSQGGLCSGFYSS